MPSRQQLRAIPVHGNKCLLENATVEILPSTGILATPADPTAAPPLSWGLLMSVTQPTFSHRREEVLGVANEKAV